MGTFQKLARFAKAKTLDDLTQEQLATWRTEIENDPKLTSAGTREGMYGQVKAVLGFGLKVGLDPTQIAPRSTAARPSGPPTPCSR